MSRLIKSEWTSFDHQKNKVISIKLLKEENQNLELSAGFSRQRHHSHVTIQQAEKEAEAIVSEARAYQASVYEQIEKEKNEWEKEKILLSNHAKKNGFEEGLTEGKQKGYEEIRINIEKSRQIIESSKLDYRNKLESSEGTILGIGLKVAEKILGEHLNGDSEHFLSIVRRTLKEARDYREIQLHIHPVHYEFVLKQKDELTKIFPKETEIYIYPDEELSEGGCVIESANGRIDASVDQQLEVIKGKLFELLESE